MRGNEKNEKDQRSLSNNFRKTFSLIFLPFVSFVFSFFVSSDPSIPLPKPTDHGLPLSFSNAIEVEKSTNKKQKTPQKQYFSIFSFLFVFFLFFSISFHLCLFSSSSCFFLHIPHSFSPFLIFFFRPRKKMTEAEIKKRKREDPFFFDRRDPVEPVQVIIKNKEKYRKKRGKRDKNVETQKDEKYRKKRRNMSKKHLKNVNYFCCFNHKKEIFFCSFFSLLFFSLSSFFVLSLFSSIFSSSSFGNISERKNHGKKHKQQTTHNKKQTIKNK